MLRIACGLVAALIVGLTANADDKKADAKDEKKADALTGTWVKEADGIELKFTFKKDTFVSNVKAGDNGIKVTCKYTVDKDGNVKATVTDVEEKGDFPSKPAKGLEMKFKFKVEGKKAKLENFEAEGAEGAKAAVEGDYESKAD